MKMHTTIVWMCVVVAVTAILIMVLKNKSGEEKFFCGDGGGCGGCGGGGGQNLGAIQVSETPNGGIYAVMPTVYAMTI
jgi:hypothetical protein